MTDDSKMAFESLPWHDAVLLNLNIERRMPGERDEVDLLVEWPSGSVQKIRFADCYAVDARMNFGVVSPDAILKASCTVESPSLADIRRKWAAIGVMLSDLQCFQINMNTTGGILCIYAKSFSVLSAESMQ